MTFVPVRQAMVLAAGLGTRMRPLTETTPKPLLPLGGRALLDHALDRLRIAGVERVVVNAHWQAGRIAAHLRARAEPPATTVQHEDTLLGTGGAVAAALRSGTLAQAPFFVVNGDSFWLDGPYPALSRLAATLDPIHSQAVLLLHRSVRIHAEVGCGDFALDPWGAVRRPAEHEMVPYLYAGVQLLHPVAFDGVPDGPFSMNLVWDRLIAAGRLTAVVHDGLWAHLSTPRDLQETEANDDFDLRHGGRPGGALR